VHIYSFELQARPGRGYAAFLRGVILGVVGRGYARSCIRTSEKIYSPTLVNKEKKRKGRHSYALAPPIYGG
jgi:hypothetical protein